MGITCCLPIRDDPPESETENSHASSSRNCSISFYFIYNKIKGVFHGNEIHHLPNSLQPREILNTSSYRVHPNSVPKSPRTTVILNKPAASVNRTVKSEILDTSSSLDHPRVESGQNQPSEQNLDEVGVIPYDEAATTVNEGVTTEIVNTSSCREHTNVESGQQNPVVEAVLDRAAVSVCEEVTAEITNTSSCREHHHQSSEQNLGIDPVPDSTAAAASVSEDVTAEIITTTSSCREHYHQSTEQNPGIDPVSNSTAAAAAASVSEKVTAEIITTSSCREHPHQSSEQNPGIDPVPGSTAAVSDGVTEILNPGSCHDHQNVENVQSPEEGLRSQTEIESSTKEASPNSEKSFTKADGTFYEVFPSADEEDVCPTCLEDYEPDNPRIVTECAHHFHLSCIYDWLERSERCPICFRLMVISETDYNQGLGAHEKDNRHQRSKN